MDTSTNPKPTVSTTKTPSAPKPENAITKFLRTWFLYRAFATLAWCWFIPTVIGREVLFRIPIVPRYFLVIPFLVTWVGFLFARKWARAVSYFPYFLFFPIALCVWIFQFFLKIFKSPFHVFRTVQASVTVCLIFVGIVVSWSITAISTVLATQASASLIALAGTYLLAFQSFRWASNPYKPLLAGIQFVSQKVRRLVERFLVKPGMTDAGSKRDNAIKVCDFFLLILDKMQELPLSRGFATFTHNSLIPTFVFGFILLYAILASSFSISLFHIERAWGPQIEGIGIENPPSLFSYFYFSFLSQATAVPDGTRPLSVYGEIWILWVVMTGILLLTILIALFTTAIGVHTDYAVSEMKILSDGTRRDFEDWRKQLSQPVIETEAIEVQANVVEAPVGVVPAKTGEKAIVVKTAEPVNVEPES